MGKRRSATFLVNRVDGTTIARVPDELAVEEPLEIHLDGVVVSTTMRTPGHDYELAVGFCHGEGLLAGAPVLGVRYCATGAAVDSEFNVVTVETGGRAPTPTPRLGTTTSSCGLCGSTTLTELTSRLVAYEPGSVAVIPLAIARALPDRVLGDQGLFARTGAVHAAAAFTPEGDVELVREDVGRHNAVDKIVGRLLLERPPARPRPRPVRVGPGQLRDGAKGVGRRVRHRRRRECTDRTRRPDRTDRGHDARRIRAR